MTRTPIIAILTAAAIAASIAWTVPPSAAEPIAGSGNTAATPPKPSPAAQELTDAAAVFKKGDYDGALKSLKEAVKKDPDLPPPHVILAQWFDQSGVAMGVRAALERAVAEAPADPQAYILIGNLALRDRRITEAKLLYDKAETLMAAWKGSAKRRDQMLPQIRSGLAFICEARDDWTGDQKQLEAWLRLDPKNVSALQRLAQCLFQQKNVDSALARLKEAAKSEPDMLTPEAMIGQWYARAGDRENAQKWMVAALKAAPKDAQTRLVAAQWAWETGQLDEAKQQVDAALRLEPKYLQAKILRGVVAMFQKDYKTAEVWFESAHQQAPKDFAASNNLALALVEQDDESKRSSALGLADVNARKYPRMGEALSTYAWVLDRLGRPEEAEKVMRDVVAAGSVTADTAYYWARILKDRGQGAAAKQWLESALRSPAPFHHRDDAKALLQILSEPAPESLPK